jgi:hypothetical protein
MAMAGFAGPVSDSGLILSTFNNAPHGRRRTTPQLFESGSPTAKHLFAWSFFIVRRSPTEGPPNQIFPGRVVPLAPANW